MPLHLPDVDHAARSGVAPQSLGFDFFESAVDNFRPPHDFDGLPKGALLASYKSSGRWDIADPKHRGCALGDPCMITGEKFCARTAWSSKFNHAYGRCGSHMGSPGHVLCLEFSEDERQRLPSCVECGILVEIQDLILIHLRILAEEPEIDRQDTDLLRASLFGYSRAYATKLTRHVEGLRLQSDDSGKLEMGYAGCTTVKTARSRLWWKRTIKEAMKKVIQLHRAPRGQRD